MARVTVEDCVDKVENRFGLVLLAAHRARMISAGSATTVERENDKNPVVALREIADQTIDSDLLLDDFITSLQKQIEMDEPEDAEGAAAEKADLPEHDDVSEDDLLRAMQNAGMTPVQPPMKA